VGKKRDIHVDYEGLFVAFMSLSVGGLGVTLVLGVFAPFLLYVGSEDSSTGTTHRNSSEPWHGPGSQPGDEGWGRHDSESGDHDGGGR